MGEARHDTMLRSISCLLWKIRVHLFCASALSLGGYGARKAQWALHFKRQLAPLLLELFHCCTTRNERLQVEPTWILAFWQATSQKTATIKIHIWINRWHTLNFLQCWCCVCIANISLEKFLFVGRGLFCHLQNALRKQNWKKKWKQKRIQLIFLLYARVLFFCEVKEYLCLGFLW